MAEILSVVLLFCFQRFTIDQVHLDHRVHQVRHLVQLVRRHPLVHHRRRHQWHLNLLEVAAETDEVHLWMLLEVVQH